MVGKELTHRAPMPWQESSAIGMIVAEMSLAPKVGAIALDVARPPPVS